MNALRYLWLALAIWGAIHPMYWFVTYMMTNGGGLGALIDAWYVNALHQAINFDYIFFVQVVLVIFGGNLVSFCPLT